MANDIKISTAARNAAMDAVTALINAGGAGSLLIYDGTKPAGPDTAITTQVLLATLTYSATSHGAAVAGVATANAITAGTGVAVGTASWARSRSGGGTGVVDHTVGTSGCDVNLSSVTISVGINVSVSSATLTHPA